MSKVKLMKPKHDGPLVLRRGGVVYELKYESDIDIPANIAAGMLGDAGLVVKFIEDDKKTILTMSDYDLALLQREFNLTGTAKDVAEKMFPTKKTIIPKKTKPIKAEKKTVKETPKKELKPKVKAKTPVESSDSTEG
tara:strand:- start:520 stop:930 length:411 start_codon:yes stop_codon:yes gene_type:complete